VGTNPISDAVAISPAEASDRSWIREVMVAEWSGETVVVHDTVYRPDALPGFVAWSGPERSGSDRSDSDGSGSERIGLITYRIDGDACEIVTLNALREGLGIGTALIAAVEAAARRAGCRRLWLLTTNDNVEALRFYQKRGFVLVAIHRDAVERSRRLKPAIPAIGMHGIPIRDEIELERMIPPSE
jgi:ribosomal protein S18 acetylase RimI-like enzyme